MRISDWSSDVCSSDLDHPPDADRTAKDVGDAVEIIVAEEAQHPRAHLVERADARKGADEIIIVRPVADEKAIVAEIALVDAGGAAAAELKHAVDSGRHGQGQMAIAGPTQRAVDRKSI